MSISTRQLLLPLIGGLLFVTAARANNVVTFCEVGRDASPSSRVTFDFDERRISGSDSSELMEIVEHGPYVGITFPLPLMVPSDDTLKKKGPYVWKMAGYKFQAWMSPADSKWLLVYARPVERPAIRRGHSVTTTTVLYSSESGVLAYQEFTKMLGQEFRSEFYLCSKNKLMLTNLPHITR